MSIDPMFVTLSPSRIVVFTCPNPINHRCHLRTPRIRVAVLDSPVAVVDGVPNVAAMIVPDNRETDWNFCTNFGHLQLLFNYPSVSRLILIGNDLPPNPLPRIYFRPPVTDTDDSKKLEDELRPLVMSLHPKVCFQNGLPKFRFITYEDDLLYRVTIARFVGPIVGEFVVEDVLMEVNDDSVDEKLRRIMKFKRTPTLIQSQVVLFPKIDGEIVTAALNLENLKKMLKKAKFYIDTTVLVHPYLIPMVSGLFLIASHLNKRNQQGFTPRALCLGVGGGALLTFLNTELGFEVVGVEADEVVLSAAKQYFGLNDGESVKLIVEDAIDLIKNFAKKGDTDDLDSPGKIDYLDAKFDVVMVDLYSIEAEDGTTAPPPEFIKKSVFKGLRSLLDDHGVLIINVVPLDNLFYIALIQGLKDVFDMVYETEVEDEVNRVVMATVSPQTSFDEHEYGRNTFLEKLRSVIPADYDQCIESTVEL